VPAGSPSNPRPVRWPLYGYSEKVQLADVCARLKDEAWFRWAGDSAALLECSGGGASGYGLPSWMNDEKTGYLFLEGRSSGGAFVSQIARPPVGVGDMRMRTCRSWFGGLWTFRICRELREKFQWIFKLVLCALRVSRVKLFGIVRDTHTSWMGFGAWPIGWMDDVI
jgi:hypothetical protein